MVYRIFFFLLITSFAPAWASSHQVDDCELAFSVLNLFEYDPSDPINQRIGRELLNKGSSFDEAQEAITLDENPFQVMGLEELMTMGRSFEEAMKLARIKPDKAHLFDNQTGKLKNVFPSSSMLATENGSQGLRAVRLNWSNGLEARAVLKDYLPLLKQDSKFELWIVVGKEERQEFEKSISSLPQNLRNRIKIAEDDKIPSLWAQDGSKTLEDRQGTLVRSTSSNDVRKISDDQHRSNAQALARTGLIQVRASELAFEGGNMIVGEKHLFVGPEIVNQVMHDLKVTRSNAHKALEVQFGKPILEVGVPSTDGRLNQLSYHVDLDMAVVQNRKSAKKEDVVIVQSTYQLLKDYFGMPPLEKMTVGEFREHLARAAQKIKERGQVTPEEASFLFSIKSMDPEKFMQDELKQRSLMNQLREKGYEVRTIPGLINFTKDAAGVDSVTYTNVVLSDHLALIPSYGITTLDEAAAKVYQDLGYKVVPMESTRYTICMKGGIRCVSETYR